MPKVPAVAGFQAQGPLLGPDGLRSPTDKAPFGPAILHTSIPETRPNGLLGGNVISY